MNGFYFDARLIKIGPQDGIGRFSSSLASALYQILPITVIIHDTRQLDRLPKHIPYVVMNDPTKVWPELFLPRRLNRLGATVVYNPLFVMGTFGKQYKLISTLHDLTGYQFRSFPPAYLPPLQRGVWWLFHRSYWPGRWVLNQADRVVTVSNTSKQDILDHHLTDRAVTVIYNAPPVLPAMPETRHIKRQLVYMGNLMPFKNVELLIRALPMLEGYHLHLIGAMTMPDRMAALKRLAGPNAARVTFWARASDEEYVQLLSEATALVSASKAEGFGLPIVEAMAEGVPVVCSDIPVFHEIAAEAALFFDPESAQDFADRVRELEQPPVRAKLVAEGLKRAADFSWSQSAAILKNLMLEMALSGSDKVGGQMREVGIHQRKEY
jgi:glycosyltransferase involved in cell wall biosynthesis